MLQITGKETFLFYTLFCDPGKKLHKYSFANERVTKKHKRMNSFCHIGDKDHCSL